MELHQLRYFVAVAELHNFTRAAEHCHVSQPSLSQQIIKLERELRTTLFERLGRIIRLTEAGRALYQRAVKILGTVEEAKTSLRDEEDWQTGEISVGAILTVAPYLLPGVIRAFLRRFTRARITVRENFTAEIVRDCLVGDLDVGIVALPIDDERLQVLSLFSEELQLALPARHPFASRRRVTLVDVSNQPFVLLDDIHCLGEQIVSFCRHNECLPVVSCTTAQLQTVQEMVATGLGVSLVPEMASRIDRSRHRVYRSLGADAPKRTIALIRHRDRYQSPLVREFATALQNWIPAKGTPRARSR